MLIEGKRIRGQFWTSERVIEAFQEFNRRYGRPPVVLDWKPDMARSKGRRDLAERYFRDDCWPHVNSVYGHRSPFESWDEAMRAAGFKPRGRGRPLGAKNRERNGLR